MTKDLLIDGGLVEVKMTNPKKTGSVTVREYHDETGNLRQLLDEHGNERVLKYTTGNKILDLSKKRDLLEYEHLKDHPIYVNGSSPIVEIVNITKDANDEVEKKTIALEALIIAKDLQGQKLADFARVLGIQTENVYESVIKKAVYNNAENEPKAFLATWEDPERPIKTMLYKGRQRGVFNMVNGVWKYKNVVMGTGIDQCLIWFKENEDLLPSIRKEINSFK